MSQLQVSRINDASGGVLAPISSVMRNRIINGAMVIDQRNAGASVTGNNNVFVTDRFRFAATQNSKLTGQQNAGSVTPPTGFTNYLGVTSSSAYSITSSDYFLIGQPIEGYNVADLGWGTANAKTVTLSFWVRSSLTGTFGGAINNNAFDRSYPFIYTISASNTWEQKSVTIAGDTTGTWLTTNGVGMYLWLGLGVGSTSSGTAGSWSGSTFLSATGATSVVGTNGATFYITGVQLEVGTQATSFEYRQYQQELALCQRYTYVINGVSSGDRLGLGYCQNTTQGLLFIYFPVMMRASPSISGTSSAIAINDGAAQYNSSSVSLQASTPLLADIQVTSSGMTQFRPAQFYYVSASGQTILSSEL